MLGWCSFAAERISRRNRSSTPWRFDQVAADDLEHLHPAHERVVREVDDPHPAPAELADDLVVGMVEQLARGAVVGDRGRRPASRRSSTSRPAPRGAGRGSCRPTSPPPSAGSRSTRPGASRPTPTHPRRASPGRKPGASGRSDAGRGGPPSLISHAWTRAGPTAARVHKRKAVLAADLPRKPKKASVSRMGPRPTTRLVAPIECVMSRRGLTGSSRRRFGTWEG